MLCCIMLLNKILNSKLFYLYFLGKPFKYEKFRKVIQKFNSSNFFGLYLNDALNNPVRVLLFKLFVLSKLTDIKTRSEV